MQFDSLELKHHLSVKVCSLLTLSEVVLGAQKLLIVWDAFLQLALEGPLVLLYISLSQEILQALCNRE